MSHVENWVLACPPLAMCIRNRRVLWKNSGNVPVEQIWVVSKCFCVKGMIVHNNRSVALQTTAETSYNEVNNPSVGDPATHVEILDWQFTNDS